MNTENTKTELLNFVLDYFTFAPTAKVKTKVDLPDKISPELAETILHILMEHHFTMAKLNVERHGADDEEQKELAMTYQTCILDRLGYDREISKRLMEKYLAKLTKGN